MIVIGKFDFQINFYHFYRDGTYKRSNSKRSQFQHSDNSNFNASVYKEKKIRLNDLDWEDRERVLRLLFSKMNSGIHLA